MTSKTDFICCCKAVVAVKSEGAQYWNVFNVQLQIESDRNGDFNLRTWATMNNLAGSLIFAGTSAMLTSILLYKKAKTSATVSELWIYPIKSCQGINVKSALIGRRGFAFDRIFMVIDRDGKFVSQRTEPKLALVAVTMDEKSRTLLITAPGMPTTLVIDLHAPKLSGEKVIECTIWGEVCTATLDSSGGKWFSEFLEAPADSYRLARIAGALH